VPQCPTAGDATGSKGKFAAEGFGGCGNQHSKNGLSLTPRQSVALVIVLCPRKELSRKLANLYAHILQESM
jgi:hypothetical protein